MVCLSYIRSTVLVQWRLAITKVLTSQNRTIIGTRTTKLYYQFVSIAGIMGICGINIPWRSIGAAARTDLCDTFFF